VSLPGWIAQSLDVPRWFRSGGYALAGVWFMLRSQSTLWFHILVLAAFCAAGAWLKISPSDWRWLAAGVFAVLAAEALNTAVEQICDLVSPGPNEHVRRAKDVAAGAVLLTAFGAWAAAGLTLWPYLAGSR